MIHKYIYVYLPKKQWLRIVHEYMHHSVNTVSYLEDLKLQTRASLVPEASLIDRDVYRRVVRSYPCTHARANHHGCRSAMEARLIDGEVYRRVVRSQAHTHARARENHGCRNAMEASLIDRQEKSRVVRSHARTRARKTTWLS